MDRDERKKAAAEHRAATESAAKTNNRRALIAGIVGLFGTSLLYAAWFLLRFFLRERRYR